MLELCEEEWDRPSWQTRGTRTGPARPCQRWRSSCRGTRTFSSIERSWPAPAPCKSRSTPPYSQLNTEKFWTNLSYISSSSVLILAFCERLWVCFGNDFKYFTDYFDRIHDSARESHDRFVGPIGAPDLWAGPWWSFQSQVRRPGFCCGGLSAVAGPVCGDKACKVSRFFKSPHETSFYWLKWFRSQWTERESQQPGKTKHIYHISSLDLGWGGLG